MNTKVYTFDDFRRSKLSNQLHYLVIGHPISHSLSPVMHNISLQYHSIHAEYIAVDVPAQSIDGFTAWMNNDHFLGCNITIPYKKQFYSLPDLLSPEAEAVGAINTISKNSEGTSLTAFNTDIFGFQKPLMEYKDDLDYGRAIVFGTGGASLAVQYALWDLGFEEIVIVSRSPSNVQPLAGNYNATVVGYSQWQEFASEAHLIVNTTPLGMGNRVHLSIVEKQDAHLLSGKICYDLVYNPVNTTFLNLASSAGAEIINGLDMLIYQGSRSFEIWTGHTFPVEIVRQKLLTFFKS